MALEEAYLAYLPLVDSGLRHALVTPEPELAKFYGLMQYHMGWLDANLAPVGGSSGKRIRPMLCILACVAAGGCARRALPLAVALELLHNYSLLHDDIEDQGAVRRHRPAAWTVFGLPHALNAGDGMFALAHSELSALRDLGVDCEVVLAVQRMFDRMSVDLTEGQFLDISFESRLDVSVAEYNRMIKGKTGALLRVAAEAGALVAEAPPRVVAAYRQFGEALGRAFQVQDDILGIWGDQALTGKSNSDDILTRKKTLPVVYALGHPHVGQTLSALYAGPPLTLADVPQVLALLEDAGAQDFSRIQAELAVAVARRALALVTPTPAATAHMALAELLDVVGQRRS